MTYFAKEAEFWGKMAELIEKYLPDPRAEFGLRSFKAIENLLAADDEYEVARIQSARSTHFMCSQDVSSLGNQHKEFKESAIAMAKKYGVYGPKLSNNG